MIKIIFLLMLSFNIFASTKKIECLYDFDTKVIELDNLTKFPIEFNENNLKYKININNINKFDKLDDYMTIQNNKGHKITYSLDCSV